LLVGRRLRWPQREERKREEVGKEEGGRETEERKQLLRRPKENVMEGLSS
jgi:hypothetical protein